MSPHPIYHPDADVGCRWLCETAGRRTPQDERTLAAVTGTLPFEGRPFPPSYFPHPSEILERVQ